jgi:EAL domain-containing protein (putative c-di-GMP-specific phosphodiesterase class I)
VVQTSVKALGFHGVGFESLVEFSQAVAERHPDCVMLDLALRTTDAIDVIQYLSQIEFKGDVILMSGLEEDALRRVHGAGERNGISMLPFLRKPFTANALRRVLEERNRPQTDGLDSMQVREALDQNWIVPWYQPQIDFLTGEIVGAEALARLVHPDLGVFTPGQFLGMLDRDQMLRLTGKLIDTVLRDLRGIRADGRDIRAGVNVPPAIMREIGLANVMRNEISVHGHRPRLTVEMIEEQVNDDFRHYYDLAAQYRIYGVEFSLDDFGAGFSNLGRLRDLPFDEIKIDRSFITNIHRNRPNRVIVKAVVDVAENLGSRVVAEGIETNEAAVVCEEIGCHVGQGFYFGRPQPIDGFRRLMNRQAAPEVSKEKQD